MAKENKKGKKEEITSTNDFLGDLEGFINAMSQVDLSKINDSITPNLEKEIAELKKNVDRFNKMADDLYKASGISEAEKEKILKDPSKCRGLQSQESLKRLHNLEINARAIGKKAAEEAAAKMAQAKEELTPNEQIQKEQEATTKKRKTLRGKKNWMPL